MNNDCFNAAGFAKRYDQALKAKYLLLNPQYSVEEIRSELGFDSLQEFQEIFEALTGQVPDGYRNCLAPALEQLRVAI